MRNRLNKRHEEAFGADSHERAACMWVEVEKSQIPLSVSFRPMGRILDLSRLYDLCATSRLVSKLEFVLELRWCYFV